MEFLLPIGAEVWITVLTKDYAGLLLEKLLNKGYSVSALHPNKSLSITRENSVSSVIGLHLSCNNQYLEVTDVVKDLQKCLSDIKAYYYSIIVISMGHISWAVGNTIIETKNEPPPKSKKKDRSHLRIVSDEPSSNNTT